MASPEHGRGFNTSMWRLKTFDSGYLVPFYVFQYIHVAVKVLLYPDTATNLTGFNTSMWRLKGSKIRLLKKPL